MSPGSVDAREEGMALILVLMAMLVLSAWGTAAILATSVESRIAGNFRSGIEMRYAAETAAERALADMMTALDWDPFLRGDAPAPFADGLPGAVRTLADGTRVDVNAVLNLANCGRLTACSLADIQRVTLERPWGLNNPIWRLHAYGPLTMVGSPSEIASQAYVVVLVGDDPAEDDDDPGRDGVRADGNPGAGVMVVRVEAFGIRGAHRALQLTLARRPIAEDEDAAESVHILSWRMQN